MYFLRIILDLLFPPRNTEALVNTATKEILGMSMRVRTHKDGTVSLLPYRIPLVKACITEAKFRDNEKAQRLLASVLNDYLISYTEDVNTYQISTVVLIPIPLSQTRLKERGYNQVERVAAYLSCTGVLFDPTILSRVRDTPPQTSLGGHARRKNIQGAFSALSLNPNHTYVVFDDVRTTGATLAEAVQTLKNTGAVRVHGLSLAH